MKSCAVFRKTAPSATCTPLLNFCSRSPTSRKDRIGSIGWCMGGGYSLDVALQEPTLAADVINYGHLATDADAIKKINAPILGLFGGQDHGITPDDVHKFEATMKQLGKKIEIKIYDDAGHAFENPNNKDRLSPRGCRRRMETDCQLPCGKFEKVAPSRTREPQRHAGTDGSFLAHCLSIQCPCSVKS